MKKYYVANLQEGAKVEDVFLVASKSVSHTRGGSPFLKLRLADKSGSIDAVKWDATESEISKINSDEYAFVHGIVRLYNGDLQVTVDTCKKCDDSIDPADFIACSTRNREEMMDELLKILSAIDNSPLKHLLDSFFGNAQFAEIFKQAPAASKVHHAYIGGLLEHTLGVVKTCSALAEMYPETDKNILLAAAALHDVGKTDEFEWTTSIRYSDMGTMVGHIVGGAMMVKDAAAKINGFDPILNLALQHAILSHHGVREYGSPKLPKSLEAVILHAADDLDAKAAMIRQAIEDSDRNGDSGLFTKRHYFLDRPIFKGIPNSLEDEVGELSDGNGNGNGAEFAEGIFDPDLLAADIDIDPFADSSA